MQDETYCVQCGGSCGRSVRSCLGAVGRQGSNPHLDALDQEREGAPFLTVLIDTTHQLPVAFVFKEKEHDTWAISRGAPGGSWHPAQKGSINISLCKFTKT